MTQGIGASVYVCSSIFVRQDIRVANWRLFRLITFPITPVESTP
jgi:hypothetical protein